MNKQVGGAVAISVGTGGRWVGKVIRSARVSAAAIVACVIGALAGASPGVAQDATWLAAPTVAGPVAGSFDFDNNANWATAGGTTPTPVPGSMTQTGTATFGVSTGTSISFSSSNTLSGFTFAVGASNYTFSNSGLQQFNDAGIMINGGSAAFTNSNGGNIDFLNDSTAGSAAFTNNNGGGTLFFNASTAGARRSRTTTSALPSSGYREVPTPPPPATRLS
jgi:hypothetical protein